MKFIEETMGAFLDTIAREHGDHEGVVYLSRGLRYTYREFNDICRQVAKAYMKIGVKKGDHVAVWATNYFEWLVSMYAVAKIGAVLVTVNTAYKIFETEYLLKQSDTGTLVLMDSMKDSNYIEIMRSLCPELDTCEPGQLKSEKFPYLKNLISLDSRQKGMYYWEDFVKLGDEVSDAELDAVQNSLDKDDVVMMQYTSGTTGFPKGVMLSHYNILNNGYQIGECMKFTPEDRLCINVPFFHCFGCVLAITASVTHATTMVPIEVYSPTKVMSAIQNERCTAVHGVPTMFIFMLEHEDFDKYDFSSLRTGIMAGSPCPINVMRDVVDKMNMKEITIVFGQTEASPGCTQTTTDDPLEVRVTTVGRELPGVECKIINPETGEECAPNEIGEFVARGYNIMKGYYKMPEATAQVIDADGWLHTGDLCFKDEDGYYHVSGRMKDMIIRGGENIYPREIEELFYTNDKVSDIQVVGVPSAELGEEVMAFIILKEDVEMTEEEAKEYALKNMARHKVPKYVAFIDAFPMNAAGKILKYKLREMGIEMLGLEQAASIETA